MVDRRTFMQALGVGPVALATLGQTDQGQAPIKVGVITNADGAHRGAYFEGLAQTPEAGAVVLADPQGTTFNDARNSLGDKLTATYESVEAMLERERPALALVTMEARLAPPLVEAALQAGCHVLAEKPACVRIEDFAQLAVLAERRERHLMLALANRLRPEVCEARRLIATGRIGQLYGLEMHTIADQTRLTRPAYRQSWFAQEARAGGGHLIWLGIHWIDLAMFLTGAQITQVSGFRGVVGGQPLDVEDSAALAFRFDNGTFGTLTSGYYLDQGYHSHIKIWGARGWLHLDPQSDVPLVWYSQDDPQAELHRFERTDGPFNYTPLVRACVQAAADLCPPPLTTRESLRALEVVFAGYRAAETGVRQNLS